MEPLTNIDLGRCKWLGAIAIACTVAIELIDIVQIPARQRTTFANRERLRRAAHQRKFRSH
jgi:hypothetical protein